MVRVLWWPLVIIISAVGLGLLVFADVESLLRAALTFWFLLVCTGMSFVRLLRIEEVLLEFILAIALSITITTLVSEILILWHMGSAQTGLLILIGLSMVGVVLQLIGIYRGWYEQ